MVACPLAPGRLGQVPRELEALGLAPGEGRHRLAQAHVAQAHGLQRLQALQDLRVVREEADRLVHGHLQHVRDGLGRHRALGRRRQRHLQDLGAEAATIAVRTAQVDVAEELHFHVLEPVATTGGAAAVARVEAEGSQGVATLFRLRQAHEDLADGVEGAHVAGRRGTRGPADGRLVDEHGIIDAFVALDGVMDAGDLARVPLEFGHGPVEDALHQGGLAGPTDAGEYHQRVQRDIDLQVLQVVFPGATDADRVFRVNTAGSLALVLRVHLPPAG